MKLGLVARISALSLLLAHCGDDDGGGATGGGAQILTKLTSAGGTPTSDKLRAGTANLESLRYYITTIMICESLDVQGSGFGNPQGCLELYKRELGALSYDLNGDWRGLADIARGSDEGYVDLIGSRSALASETPIRPENAHAYNYGIINWALPIKVRGSVPFADGTTLYTHDGPTTFDQHTSGFRAYYTTPTTPLTSAPAQDAVVILGNGGNWFKFQTPLNITAADVEEKRAFVLDLVFNPQGIVNGYADSFGFGSIRQNDGTRQFDITVPYLDLAPVPHRADQRVVRESYRGAASVDGNAFDLRIELYSIEGEDAVYGADVKTLVTSASTSAPPAVAKASFVDREADGTLSFSSWKHTPVISGFTRAATTRVAVKCGEHTDRAAAEGGAAIIVDRCPGATIDVALTRVSRNIVEGSVPVAVGVGPVDAGVVSDAASLLDAR
ncbi:MAG TPA: hypothetical protein VFX59_13875 [Polyangiales bacterium]|nr:hypothetical protein [Polyangiales bacterium]